ncbi:phosphotransferase family protein [Streptomyces hoynatensis]|uniref:Aminoglycoside phosphotransferase family protein n=1 Tax=Streptomyces hoynatensis TaxID=1141874 RepID=A0A3A9Z7E7_9ACTN|nr:aminoglycoside phosphotransferase family protein [Streptomyces hoynatensis]RKN43197.1 aminoglycoside phosphotransferase family protein [Streptomyces hoynatensis]
MAAPAAARRPAEVTASAGEGARSPGHAPGSEPGRPNAPGPGRGAGRARALALRVAARYGVPADEVVLAPAQGAASVVHLLGRDLVLKAALADAPGPAADLCKEAAVIPHVRDLGVPTPELLELGEPAGAAPYLVLRRAPGVSPGEEPGPRLHRSLGRALARLHGAAASPPAAVPADAQEDPRPGVERLAADGYLSAGLARWLIGWFGALAARLPAAPPRPVLIHGDVSAGNLLAEPGTGELTALLDWGDAALADPAVEFAKVPPRAVPEVLAGYLGEGGGEERRQWLDRVLWHHLGWALARLPTPPEPRLAHWSAQPGNRLLELLRCYAEGPDAGWMRSQRLP